MFNLFGKKTDPIETKVEEQPQVSNKYPEVVEQIHNEFFTAGDCILEEAKQLLASLETKDLAKGERLAAIGFNKTKEAITAIETKNKVARTKEIADLVVYYKENYPFNKFITEEQVKSICEKYGLVFGNTIAYKGFVPENKLTVIEKFNLKNIDTPFIQLLGTKYKSSGYNETINDAVIGYLNENLVVDKWAANQIKQGGYFYASVNGVIDKYVDKNAVLELSGKWEYIKAEPFDKKLKICAPLKDMEVGTRQQVVGYKIQDIPDPVVLQPVNGGFLIICAWGDESSDPIVVNEVNN